MNINFSVLDMLFPDYVWTSRGLEVCGLHKSGTQFITIDDGMCTSNDGTWVVFIYSFDKKENSPLTCPKYRIGEKHIERRINLTEI